MYRDNMNIETIISTIFPNKKKAGELAFNSVEKILTLKALFPNLNTENVINLFSHCYYKRYEPIDMVRLSDIENKGFKVKKKIKDLSKILFEYSPYLDREVESVFFDISSTNLPRKLHRSSIIKEFEISNDFINSLEESFFKSSSFKLKSIPGNKIDFDFKNKIVGYPEHKDNNKRLSSLLRSIITLRMVKNEDRYERIIKNSEDANKLKINIVLIENAIFESLLLDKNISLNNILDSDSFRNNFVWGEDNDSVLKKIEYLNQTIEQINNDLNLEYNLQLSFNNQLENKKKLINSNNNQQTLKFSDSQYTDEKKAERFRLSQEILNIVSIEDIIRDFTNNEIKKDGANWKTKCISPNHQDSEPSLKINKDFTKCNCFACGTGGNVLQVYAILNNLNIKKDYPKIIDSLVDYYNIPNNYSFIEEKYNVSNTKESLVEKIILEFKETITSEEYEELTNLNISQLNNYMHEKRLLNEKNEIYTVKEKTNSDYNRTTPSSYVLNIDSVYSNTMAVKYLKEIRGFNIFPDELKYFVGKHKNEATNKISTSELVGFINESNGADGKYFAGNWIGKPKSCGTKDITILNKHNLNKKNIDFIVAESQWDLIAFFNDPDCKKVMDNCVNIVLNGTSVDKTIDFINTHKNRDSALYLLRQADISNAKAMQRLHFGTGITKISHFNYTDQEVERKKDVNDLLRDGVKLSDRINLNLRTLNEENTHKNYLDVV